MERMIYDAAVRGSVISLLNLLQEDALALDRFMVGCYPETPLHIASMLGHLEFVQEILNRKPELAGELDARKSSPLHLAAAKGYLDIVKILVSINPEICFARDCDGRNPLHIATIKGHISVLRELVNVRPQAARSLVDRGETILHLCMRYNQLEILKFLVETVGDHDEFVNSKGDYGNTILHMAVADKQVEAIEFLTCKTKTQVNATNAYGLTALDILTQSNRDFKDRDIGELLRHAGAMSAKHIDEVGSTDQTPRTSTSHENYRATVLQSSAGKKGRRRANFRRRHKGTWTDRMSGALMIVAILIATMAFQVAVNPPGGVWQEDSSGGAPASSAVPDPYQHLPGFSIFDPDQHLPGFSIFESNHPGDFIVLWASNTTGFFASLMVILLLISGLPCQCRCFMWILMVVMWIAVSAMALTYIFSVRGTTHSLEPHAALRYVMLGWIGLLGLLLLGHIIRVIVKTTIWFIRLIMRCCPTLCSCAFAVNRRQHGDNNV